MLFADLNHMSTPETKIQREFIWALKIIITHAKLKALLQFPLQCTEGKFAGIGNQMFHYNAPLRWQEGDELLRLKGT